MAIVINGSGTITGLSVGGLPDGTVDEDTLAASSVSAAKHKPNAGSGAIIQVKSTSTAATTQYGSTSSYSESAWIDITELAVSITPTAATSKIHIAYNLMGEPSENEHRMRMRVKKAISGGSTTYINAPAASNRSVTMGMMCQGYFDDQNDSTPGYFAMPSYVDSPSTTSAQTYSVFFARTTGSGTARVQSNGSQSNLTLVEVAQ